MYCAFPLSYTFEIICAVLLIVTQSTILFLYKLGDIWSLKECCLYCDNDLYFKIMH